MSNSKENVIKTGAEKINPYDDRREKATQVEEMFDSIAPAYDFMNTAMSFGLHRRWRDKALYDAIRALPRLPEIILDVATGTGDVAFRLHSLLPMANICGIDLSGGMIEVARRRLSALSSKEQDHLHFDKADCLDLPYRDGEFELITVAYGVRNFENLHLGLCEMRRVLCNGGVLCIIELSCPEGKLTGMAYRLYSRHIIPVVGRLVSGDSRAYSYLPESIAAAPQREAMVACLRKAGFTDIFYKSLTFGAVTYYIAK